MGMTIKELREALASPYYKDEQEVTVRAADVDNFGINDGDYLEIDDVLVEHGKVVIVADLEED